MKDNKLVTTIVRFAPAKDQPFAARTVMDMAGRVTVLKEIEITKPYEGKKWHVMIRVGEWMDGVGDVPLKLHLGSSHPITGRLFDFALKVNLCHKVTFDTEVNYEIDPVSGTNFVAWAYSTLKSLFEFLGVHGAEISCNCPEIHQKTFVRVDDQAIGTVTFGEWLSEKHGLIAKGTKTSY